MHSETRLSNTIKYNGNVDIKLKRNGNCYKLCTHNTGTKELTNTIVRALCGNSVSQDIPMFLTMGAIKKNGNEETFIPVLRYEIPFTGITWGDVVKPLQNGTAMLLTATILPDDKLNLSNVNAYEMELQMRSSNNNILATIRCSGQDDQTAIHDLYNSLSDGTSGIIEWCMEFKF